MFLVPFGYLIQVLFNIIYCALQTREEVPLTESLICRARLKVLNEIDEALADVYKFNNELLAFDKTLTEMDTWINGKAQV